MTPFSTSNYATAAANTAVTITYAASGAQVNRPHAIRGLVWSYSGGTPVGSLTITEGGTTVFSIDITSEGPGFINWPLGAGTSSNIELAVTLAAGGSDIVGKLNVLNYDLA